MKKIFLILFAVISIQMVYGQGGYFALTYSVGVPMGDLKTYIGQTSFRGANMEFYWHAKPNLDAGFEVGWNVFYEKKDKATYTQGTESINGVQFRYTNAVPLIAGVRWRKKSGGNLDPYIGIGLGTTSVNRSTDFGLYRIYTNSWQFCVRPEAGILYHLGGGTSATLGVKYYANFGNNELDAQPYLAVQAGFIFAFGR
jgi:hypothetical protein